jgi:hypothetical protein
MIDRGEILDAKTLILLQHLARADGDTGRTRQG